MKNDRKNGGDKDLLLQGRIYGCDVLMRRRGNQTHDTGRWKRRGTWYEN